MSLSINTNIASTRASKHLASNHQNLQKSLDRLSSGKRITQASDDAGGLAVAMKLENTINGLKGAAMNIANGISYLQVQDGILDSAGQIVARMGELRGLYDDVTKSTADKDLYDSEFQDLMTQLNSLASAKFNGVDLLSAGAAATVSVTGANGTSIDLTQHGFATDINAGTVVSVAIVAAGVAQKVNGNSATEYANALGVIAGFRATNGGQAKRLEFAQADVNTQITNMTAAHGRIMDVDIAAESANLAKQQILVQASAAMVAQANAANNVALTLLQ